MHGGVKFYRGAAKAARAYVERDRSRADDYYLGEGTGVADAAHRHPGRASSSGVDGRRDLRAVGRRDRRRHRAQKGRVREDAQRAAVRRGHRQRPEDLVAGRGPSSGDLGGAGRSPGQGRRPRSSAGSPQHATTRVGPRGRQVQVPVERIEAAVIRHYTSRAGDPHRHLHLQINARVFAAGAWRGLHSVGVRDIDRGDQRHRARRGRRPTRSSGRSSPRTGSPWTPRPARSRELAPYVGAFSARTARSAATSTGTKPSGGASIPARSRGRGCARRGIGGRGPMRGRTRSSPRTALSWWRDGTPSCATSATATRPPPSLLEATPVGWIDRDARPSWSSPSSGRSGRPGTPPTSAARSRSCSAQANLVADPAARIELAEDITARAADRCVRLLA